MLRSLYFTLLSTGKAIEYSNSKVIVQKMRTGRLYTNCKIIRMQTKTKKKQKNKPVGKEEVWKFPDEPSVEVTGTSSKALRVTCDAL